MIENDSEMRREDDHRGERGLPLPDVQPAADGSYYVSDSIDHYVGVRTDDPYAAERWSPCTER